MMTEKTQSIEQGIIGYLLTDVEAYTIANGILKAEMFNEAISRILYTEIDYIYKNGNSIDVVLIDRKFKDNKVYQAAGGVIYITDAMMYATRIDFRERCLLILEQHIGRTIIASLNKSVVTYRQDNDLEMLLNDLTKLAQTSNEMANVADSMVSMAHIAKEYTQILEQRQANRLAGISNGITTGITPLNNFLNGGFKGGQLIIVAGRPGMGKTAAMLHFAKAAAIAGNHCLIFELEMTKVALFERLTLSTKENLDFKTLKNGSFKNWSEIHKAIGSVEKLPIYVDESASITTRQIRSKCFEKKREGKCDIVMIDYLQLISSTESAATREQVVAQISREAKILAKDLDVPVIMICQLSRAVEQRGDKMPQLSDLRESGSLEQDADAVLFVFRPEYYGINEVDVNNNIISSTGVGMFLVAKQRDGATGVVPFRYNANVTQLYDFETIKELEQYHSFEFGD